MRIRSTVRRDTPNFNLNFDCRASSAMSHPVGIEELVAKEQGNPRMGWITLRRLSQPFNAPAMFLWSGPSVIKRQRDRIAMFCVGGIDAVQFATQGFGFT